jgi:hypothetical protein
VGSDRVRRFEIVEAVESLVRAENWVMPEDDDDWQAAREHLNAALATPFTSKSRESTKPHHSRFSFLEAMLLAVDGGTTPLARFIRDRRGRELLSEQDWQYLAVFIRSLWKPPQQRRGRPKHGAASDGSNAENYAAYLVAMSQAAWRAQNEQKRVPGNETNTMIAQAIKKVAADLEVPADKIKPDNIRNLLKSGRILAHT